MQDFIYYCTPKMLTKCYELEIVEIFVKKLHLFGIIKSGQMKKIKKYFCECCTKTKSVYRESFCINFDIFLKKLLHFKEK